MTPFLRKSPSVVVQDTFEGPDGFRRWMRRAFVVAAFFCLCGLILCLSLEGCGGGGTERPDPKSSPPKETSQKPVVENLDPVRPAPAAFPPNTNMPRGKETLHSGAIQLDQFDPKRDLIRFEDARVWFESDHDTKTGDKEDDHLMHRMMELPMKRLVRLVEGGKGKLKVQDCYRAASENRIHLAKSLHCEGRAIDLTAEGLSLEELSKMCWRAGFDFVLYETPRGGGAHVHCSVRRVSPTK